MNQNRQQQPAAYIIPADLLIELIKYLITRPMLEVEGAVQALRQLQPYDPERVKDGE